MMDLKNKIILVTGASRGIGKAIAIHLAKAGATVAVHYNQSKHEASKMIPQLGNNAYAFQADLAQPESFIPLFSNVMRHYGRVHGLVNNAGIAIASSLTIDEHQYLKDWEKSLMVNLNAVAILCKQAINHFGECGGGRIVNISSRAAFRGDTPDYMAYAASKGGMVALTRSIARGFGKKGIVAFNIAPGFTNTTMAKDFIDKYGKNYALNDIALSELTEPEDIAPMITFLMSGLGDHATGGTFDFNAGSYVH